MLYLLRAADVPLMYLIKGLILGWEDGLLHFLKSYLDRDAAMLCLVPTKKKGFWACFLFSNRGTTDAPILWSGI